MIASSLACTADTSAATPESDQSRSAAPSSVRSMLTSGAVPVSRSATRCAAA